MTDPGTRRIAVVGIDGSGKSSLVRRILEAGGSRLALACPAYHDTPNAPLADLSRTLDVLSRTADALGSVELKAAAMFLQMTLFGPVERFLVETFAPRVLLTERHAVVDTLAYGPLYGQLVRAAPDPVRFERPLRDALGERGFEAVLAWHRAEQARLGLDLTLWDLPVHLAALCRRPLPEALPELCRRYRAGLPEALVLLDLPGDVALARVAGRSAGARELHEKAELLEHLRRSYLAVSAALRDAHGVAVHVVDVARLGPDEAQAAVLAAVG